jgi:two-component system LytT family sensor kinase
MNHLATVAAADLDAASVVRRRHSIPGWAIWGAAALLLGVYQGLNAWIGVLGSTRASWEPFVWELSSIWMVMWLLPVVVRLERRFNIDSKPRSRVLLAHASGLLVFSVLHTTGMLALRYIAYNVMGSLYDAGDLWLRYFYEFQKDVILYSVVIVVVFAVREFRVRRASELRAAQLAAEVGEARLRQLTAQIEPHFLFNSLNAISNRMHEDVEAADRMISQLGDLLRAAYESDRSVLVPLARELEWLRGYAAMMGERFRGQLAFVLDVAPGLDAIRVPRLLIQPIVENALEHGLAGGGGSVRVTVRRSGARLEYEVSDDGVGLADAEPARGTGLSNIGRRLELLFPSDHTLRIAPRAPRGVVVTVAFPAAG